MDMEVGEPCVPLAAVALQFSTQDPRIRSTVVGVSAPGGVDQLVANEELEIPSGSVSAKRQLT